MITIWGMFVIGLFVHGKHAGEEGWLQENFFVHGRLWRQQPVVEFDCRMMSNPHQPHYDPFSDPQLQERQLCACLIQAIASRIQTTQVVVNSALYFMHHFYEAFAPKNIKPIVIALATTYCACKVEDFSRKLSFLIRAMYEVMRRPPPEESSETARRLVATIHGLEAQILMSIGFKTLEVKQPHVLLINAIQSQRRLPGDIACPAYYICTNMLHLTSLWLRHSSEALACASLYIAVKWANVKDVDVDWFPSLLGRCCVSMDEVRTIADEFTLVFQACDQRVKATLKSVLRARRITEANRRQSLHSSSEARLHSSSSSLKRPADSALDSTTTSTTTSGHRLRPPSPKRQALHAPSASSTSSAHHQQHMLHHQQRPQQHRYGGREDIHSYQQQRDNHHNQPMPGGGRFDTNRPTVGQSRSSVVDSSTNRTSSSTNINNATVGRSGTMNRHDLNQYF